MKRLIQLGILLSSIIMVVKNDSIIVSAENDYHEDIGVDALLPPTRIWWDWTADINYGDSYYYEIYRRDGVYRGYLSINWNLSGGGNYTYEGYLYHQSLPYPMPARVVEEKW